MSEADICAVVVTHQSAATIDECLARLRASQSVAAIRVTDNNSSDGSFEIIQRHAAADPRVRFIANPDNPGFAVACNQGASTCDTAWLAFVNPDCLLEHDSLQRMRAHAGQFNGNALIGADLVYENGERDAASRRRDPDFAAMLRSRAASQLELSIDHTTPLQRVDAVSGALMLLPRTLFDRIGRFDEHYRLHAEDLDLCRRVRTAGGVIAVANDVRVVHVRGVSSRERPVFVEWHKHRGLARYFRKFEASQRGWLTRLLVLTAIWLRFPIAAMRAVSSL
ncbi:MAG: glycosyltransferase family 2 protein [Lysobacter sp.]|nr:glycosyltransferase family 2 protein [Lysobacter sp.]